jgi:hypothetical protein
MENGLRISAFVFVLAACALLAASVGVGGAPAGSAVEQAAGGQAGQTADTVHVNIVINRFVRQGRRIVAQGAVVGRYRSDERGPVVVRKPFTARLTTRRASFASSARICDVLSLTIEQLHLELLGLIVHLDRVHLTIKADSRGGILGSLFCSIAGGRATPERLQKTANRMTKAAHSNGLNQGVTGFQVQVAPGFAQTGQICQILDLVLGPLDLNLLGLMVHLDRVHLSITAERGGGVLGDLFCSLAGGPSPPPPPPAPLPAPGQGVSSQ